MKKLLISLFLSISLSFGVHAQTALYPDMCDVLQQVFCDYARRGETRYVSNKYGQYVGQFIDNNIYGWGFFITDDDSQTFGQFRKGKHLFGITVTPNIARVGSDEHYVEYDITTGKIIRQHTNEGYIKPLPPYIDTDTLASPYAFKRIEYSNGDVYMGETYNGRRHGYGVYYWTNGDFWYGKYENGYRQGYGALFKVDRRLFYGKWIGDTKVE